MPFGMINSSATLKRAMKKLIADLDNVDFTGTVYWFIHAPGKGILKPSESCLHVY